MRKLFRYPMADSPVLCLGTQRLGNFTFNPAIEKISSNARAKSFEPMVAIPSLTADQPVQYRSIQVLYRCSGSFKLPIAFSQKAGSRISTAIHRSRTSSTVPLPVDFNNSSYRPKNSRPFFWSMSDSARASKNPNVYGKL